MRKVSRADETSEINYHNAGRPWGPPKVVQIQPAPASQETIDRQNRSVIIPGTGFHGPQHEYTYDTPEGRCTTCGRPADSLGHRDHFERSYREYGQQQVRLPSTENTREVTFLPRDVEPDPRGVFDFDLGRYTNEPDPDEPADMGQAPVDWNAINQQGSIMNSTWQTSINKVKKDKQ